jgi:hypothetical protein
MADMIYGYAPDVIECVMETAPPAVRRLLDNGIVLAVPPPATTCLASAFEEWLIARWLHDIRSSAFTASAQGQYLIAEWERGPK